MSIILPEDTDLLKASRQETYWGQKGVKKVKNHGRELTCEVCGVSSETHRVILRKRIINGRKVYVCDICIGRGR